MDSPYRNHIEIVAVLRQRTRAAAGAAARAAIADANRRPGSDRQAAAAGGPGQA
jgi:DNA-binding FadR family transcriptional regulator